MQSPAQLGNMGSEPLGALERIPSLVEYREWGREALAGRDDAVGGMLDEAVAGDADDTRAPAV